MDVPFFSEENDCNVPLLESTLLKSVSVSSGNGSSAYDVIHGRKIPAGNLGYWKPGSGDREPYVKVKYTILRRSSLKNV